MPRSAPLRQATFWGVPGLGGRLLSGPLRHLRGIL